MMMSQRVRRRMRRRRVRSAAWRRCWPPLWRAEDSTNECIDTPAAAATPSPRQLSGRTSHACGVRSSRPASSHVARVPCDAARPCCVGAATRTLAESPRQPHTRDACSSILPAPRAAECALPCARACRSPWAHSGAARRAAWLRARFATARAPRCGAGGVLSSSARPQTARLGRHAAAGALRGPRSCARACACACPNPCAACADAARVRRAADALRVLHSACRA